MRMIRVWRSVGAVWFLVGSLGLAGGGLARAADWNGEPEAEIAPGTIYEEAADYLNRNVDRLDEDWDDAYDAPEPPEYGCLQNLFTDACGNNWLGDRNITLSGWMSQGVTWNSHNTSVNGPVTFNDRADEYQLNQLYLFLEKGIDQNAQQLQVGGRVDLLFGTDYYFTQSIGLELHSDGSNRWNSERGPNRAFGRNTGSLYGFAMPQLYAEVGGYGWSFRFGHFYTIIGYEVVTAPDNFFYSHAYTMQYSEPFTHTGMLATYNLSDNWTLSAGIHNGWDSFTNPNKRVGFLGGVSWTSDSGDTSLAFAITTGDEDVDNGTDNLTMYSIVGTRNITDRLSYVIQHDLGVHRGAAAGGRTAQWYGVNQYLFYQINDRLRSGLRYEWYRDDDGVRVLGDGRGVNFYQLTAGLNWRIRDNIMLRPELRYDWADSGSRPFNGGRRGSQFLYGTDLIIMF